MTATKQPAVPSPEETTPEAPVTTASAAPGPASPTAPRDGAASNGQVAVLDVPTAIRTRRTIRRWTDQPVSDEIIKELLECALWAPSACNMQLWDFVVVTDPEIRRSLADAVPFADKAQLCIFICYNTRFSEGSYANIQSASAAVMNMLLRAHSLGLGGFWQATIHDRQQLRQTLGLPKDVEVLSTTLFGYPAEQPGAPARRDPSHLVHWQRYHPKPTLPSSPDPAAWRLDQVADYQQARIRAGPKYNKPIQSEYQAVRGYLGHALRRVGAKRVLDLLPCTGLYLEAIAEEVPPAELHFVELGQQVADFARARLPRQAIYHHYRGQIDLPDASIDAATCVFRLENLPPAERITLLREARRVLKPGGTLALAHINRASYFELMRLARTVIGRRDVQYALATDPSLGPFTALLPAEVDRLLRQAGFSIEHTHTIFPLPPEDEARFRVRAFHNAAAALQYPVAAAYRLTRPVHAALAPLGKIRLLTART
ncbi:MAG TPA: nitroreductase family protein [Chloroflexota bacterium]|nr:nitroreductase family protein [Chloroflexota bacterium]